MSTISQQKRGASPYEFNNCMNDENSPVLFNSFYNAPKASTSSGCTSLLPSVAPQRQQYNNCGYEVAHQPPSTSRIISSVCNILALTHHHNNNHTSKTTTTITTNPTTPPPVIPQSPSTHQVSALDGSGGKSHLDASLMKHRFHKSQRRKPELSHYTALPSPSYQCHSQQFNNHQQSQYHQIVGGYDTTKKLVTNNAQRRFHQPFSSSNIIGNPSASKCRPIDSVGLPLFKLCDFGVWKGAELGRGYSGSVHRGLGVLLSEKENQIRESRPMALKLTKSKIIDFNNNALMAHGREFETLKFLYSNGVPVPRPLGFCMSSDGQGNGRTLMTMDLIDGQTLREWINSRTECVIRHTPTGRTIHPVRSFEGAIDRVDVALSLLEALSKLHPFGVFVDLKPRNIMVTRRKSAHLGAQGGNSVTDKITNTYPRSLGQNFSKTPVTQSNSQYDTNKNVCSSTSTGSWHVTLVDIGGIVLRRDINKENSLSGPQCVPSRRDINNECLELSASGQCGATPPLMSTTCPSQPHSLQPQMQRIPVTHDKTIIRDSSWETHRDAVSVNQQKRNGLWNKILPAYGRDQTNNVKDKNNFPLHLGCPMETTKDSAKKYKGCPGCYHQYDQAEGSEEKTPSTQDTYRDLCDQASDLKDIIFDPILHRHLLETTCSYLSPELAAMIVENDKQKGSLSVHYQTCLRERLEYYDAEITRKVNMALAASSVSLTKYKSQLSFSSKTDVFQNQSVGSPIVSADTTTDALDGVDAGCHTQNQHRRIMNTLQGTPNNADAYTGYSLNEPVYSQAKMAQQTFSNNITSLPTDDLVQQSGQNWKCPASGVVAKASQEENVTINKKKLKKFYLDRQYEDVVKQLTQHHIMIPADDRTQDNLEKLPATSIASLFKTSSAVKKSRCRIHIGEKSSVFSLGLILVELFGGLRTGLTALCHLPIVSNWFSKSHAYEMISMKQNRRIGNDSVLPTLLVSSKYPFQCDNSQMASSARSIDQGHDVANPSISSASRSGQYVHRPIERGTIQEYQPSGLYSTESTVDDVVIGDNRHQKEFLDILQHQYNFQGCKLANCDAQHRTEIPRASTIDINDMQSSMSGSIGLPSGCISTTVMDRETKMLKLNKEKSCGQLSKCSVTSQHRVDCEFRIVLEWDLKQIPLLIDSTSQDEIFDVDTLRKLKYSSEIKRKPSGNDKNNPTSTCCYQLAEIISHDVSKNTYLAQPTSDKLKDESTFQLLIATDQQDTKRSRASPSVVDLFNSCCQEQELFSREGFQISPPSNKKNDENFRSETQNLLKPDCPTTGKPNVCSGSSSTCIDHMSTAKLGCNGRQRVVVSSFKDLFKQYCYPKQGRLSSMVSLNGINEDQDAVVGNTCSASAKGTTGEDSSSDTSKSSSFQCTLSVSRLVENILDHCLQADPTKRPSYASLKRMLLGLRMILWTIRYRDAINNCSTVISG